MLTFNWQPSFSKQLIPILLIIHKSSNFHDQIIRIIIYYDIINNIIIHINTIIGILTPPNRMIMVQKILPPEDAIPLIIGPKYQTSVSDLRTVILPI